MHFSETLNVYDGAEHDQEAQKPRTINLNESSNMETIHKIGRRKTAVARVYLSEGKGNITVTNKLDTYFTTATLQYKVIQPLVLLTTEKL